MECGIIRPAGDVVVSSTLAFLNYVISAIRRLEMSNASNNVDFRIESERPIQSAPRDGYASWTIAVPGVNCNEEPVDSRVIDTSKLAKITISNEMVRRLLELPDDVKVTSIHTVRGDENTGIYMICDRFDHVPQGAVAPELSIDDVKNKGLWDAEAN